MLIWYVTASIRQVTPGCTLYVAGTVPAHAFTAQQQGMVRVLSDRIIRGAIGQCLFLLHRHEMLAQDGVSGGARGLQELQTCPHLRMSKLVCRRCTGPGSTRGGTGTCSPQGRRSRMCQQCRGWRGRGHTRPLQQRHRKCLRKLQQQNMGLPGWSLRRFKEAQY